MATIKQSLEELLTVDGAMCCALVDASSGMMLGSAGSGLDLEVAAAGNTSLVRTHMKTMADLELNDEIDDILISLGRQYHLIQPLPQTQWLFLYCVLDKAKSNLIFARRKLLDVGTQIKF